MVPLTQETRRDTGLGPAAGTVTVPFHTAGAALPCKLRTTSNVTLMSIAVPAERKNVNSTSKHGR